MNRDEKRRATAAELAVRMRTRGITDVKEIRKVERRVEKEMKASEERYTTAAAASAADLARRHAEAKGKAEIVAEVMSEVREAPEFADTSVTVLEAAVVQAVNAGVDRDGMADFVATAAAKAGRAGVAR